MTGGSGSRMEDAMNGALPDAEPGVQRPDGAASGQDEGPRRPRTNAELRDEAIQRMMETSIRLIAERGAARLSLVDVGRESGYSHSLPNYYFRSKRGLLMQVCAFIIERANERIPRWARAHAIEPIRPGLSNVKATIRAYLGLTQDNPSTSRVLHVLWSEAVSSLPELLEAVRPRNRQSVEFFRAELQTAIRRGEIDPDTDVDMLALLIMSALRGSVAQYMADPDRVDLIRVSEALVTLVDRAYGVRPATPLKEHVSS